MFELAPGVYSFAEPSGSLPDAGDEPPLSEYEPSGLVMDALLASGASELDADQLIDVITAWNGVIAAAQAGQARALAAFAVLRPGEHGAAFSEFAGDEIGPALGISRHAANARLALATTLTQRLPGTLAAMERGEIDLTKARVLDEVTANLSNEHAAAVEAAVLPRAATQTHGQLRAAARRAVLRVDPDGGRTRHQAARQHRRVELHPAEDGMASLWALLPADEAIAIYRHLDHIGRQARTPGDTRTADNRRADTFRDLLLGHTDRPAVTTQIQVTVAATTLLGLNEQPAELAGYGPIPAALARELAADGTWRRLLTDPATGALLDYGRTTYRPPAALADHVRTRDKTCRFYGCRMPAEHCDLDHSLPYEAGGCTCDINLAALCRHHHRLKHETNWALTHHAGAVLTWTSPTGRTYQTEPEHLGEPPGHPDPPPF